MEKPKLTDQERAALFDISFELGWHNYETFIWKEIGLCNITYQMAGHYLEQLKKVQEKNEKQKMLEEFCNKTQGLSIKSKQILVWNMDRMRAEDIYHGLYEHEKRNRADDLHDHRVEMDKLKEELEHQKQLNQDLIKQLQQ